MPPGEVDILPLAVSDLRSVSKRERAALRSALGKLAAMGEELGYPHTSAVQGRGEALRELRPRQGNSPVRAFYRRVGERIVVAAFGPEAQVDQRGFNRAVAAAIERLATEGE